VGSDENELAGDLWQLAHGSIDMQTFIDRHGYHGPNEYFDWGQASGGMATFAAFLEEIATRKL